MRIIEAKNYEDMSKKAAEIIAAQILLKPDAVLGLATGSTPVGTYQNLIKKYEAGELDFSQVSSVNLDEYKGLSGDHDQSYRYFMNENLFNHVNIDKSRTSVPNGLEEDAAKACADYDAVIAAAGGVDLQLLGIGGNGHIGFNEPAEEFKVGTHCVKLTESTRPTLDSLPPSMMFPSTPTPWESETLWRQRLYCWWLPARTKPRPFMILSSAR